MVKNKLCKLANWAVVRRSKPVALSRTAPVARWYRVRASVPDIRICSISSYKKSVPVAIKVRVVPVSTIPAVEVRIEVDAP